MGIEPLCPREWEESGFHLYPPSPQARSDLGHVPDRAERTRAATPPSRDREAKPAEARAGVKELPAITRGHARAPGTGARDPVEWTRRGGEPARWQEGR